MTAAVSTGIFAVALVVGSVLLVQDYRLRRHVVSGMALVLPPLHTLSRVLSGLLSAGWVLLTLVILTGAAMMTMKGRAIWMGGAHWNWAILAWLVYAVILFGRWIGNWRGRQGVLLSLLGFAAILFTFVMAHSL
jgi:ABC-type uncharacterized transport system permease subunit